MKPEEIAQLEQEVRQVVHETLKDRAKKQILESVNWQLSQEVTSQIGEFIKKEVGPAVQQELMANKAAILGAVTKAAGIIGQDLEKVIVLRWQERVKDTYHQREMLKALLGD